MATRRARRRQGGPAAPATGWQRILGGSNSEPGYLTGVLALRLAAVFGLTIWVGLQHLAHPGAPPDTPASRAALGGIFLYALGLGVIRALSPSLFLSAASRRAQVLLDTVMASAVYVACGAPQADVFLLYYLPLLTVGEYASSGVLLGLLGLECAALALSATVTTSLLGTGPSEWNGVGLGARLLLFAVVGSVYILHRVTGGPGKQRLLRQQAALLADLDRISDRRLRDAAKGRLEQYSRLLGQALETRRNELALKNELVNEQITTIFEASQVQFGDEDEHTIAAVLEKLGEALGCQAGVLRLRGTDAQGEPALVWHASYGYLQKYIEEARYLPLSAGSLAVQVFQSSRIKRWADVQAPSSQGRPQPVHYAALVQAADLHSMICVPLRLRNETRGTLTLYRQAVRPFTTDEEKVCSALAGYLTLMIENNALYAQRGEWLKTLNTISVALAGQQDLASLLRQVAEEIRTALNSEVAAVFLLDGEDLTRQALAGLDAGFLREEHYRIGEGVTGQVIRVIGGRNIGHPIRDNHIAGNPAVITPYVAAYKTALPSGRLEHLLLVPLVGKAGPFGALRVMNKLDGVGGLVLSGYSARDEELLTTIAHIVGIAVEDTRVLGESKRQMERQAALQAAARAIASSLAVTDVVRATREQGRLLAEAQAASVALVNDTGELTESQEDFAGLLPLHLRARAAGATHRAVRSMRPVLVADVTPAGAANPAVVQRGIQCYAAIPLVAQDRVRGVLNVYYDRPYDLPAVVPVLTTMASQAAAAIENARLYDQAATQRARLGQYLADVANELMRHTDLQGLCTFVVHSVAHWLEAEDCSLYLLSEDGQNVVLAASSCLPPAVIGVKPTLVSAAAKAGLTAYTAATGEALRFVGEEYKTHRAWAGEYLGHLPYLPSQRCRSVLLVPIREAGHPILGVLKTENKRGKEALQGFSAFDQELLELLAGHLAVQIVKTKELGRLHTQIAKTERANIADQLHGALNLLHSGVMLAIDTARVWLTKGNAATADENLERGARVAQFTYTEVSNILQDLRNSVLVEHGLRAALQDYVDVRAAAPLDYYSNLGHRLPFEAEYALYRFAQEAINNAIKHAQVTDKEGGTIKVDLLAEDGCVILRVADNGVGFTEPAPGEEDQMRFGMQRLQELARQLDGDFGVDSAPGRGTTVEVRICVKEQEREPADSGGPRR